MPTARRICCPTIACVLLALTMTGAAAASASQQDLRSPDARDAATGRGTFTSRDVSSPQTFTDRRRAVVTRFKRSPSCRYDDIALVPLDFSRPERHARQFTSLALVRGSQDASATGQITAALDCDEGGPPRWDAQRVTKERARGGPPTCCTLDWISVDVGLTCAC